MGLFQRLFLKKCCICQGKENLKHCVERDYLCDDNDWYYHDACIKEAVCNPEKHTAKQVRFAIRIVDILKDEERQRVDREKCALDACKYLSKKK